MARGKQVGLRINKAMDVLDISAYALARESGVDHSLISKWQQGSRPITRRSKQLHPVVRAMLRLDEKDELKQFYAPYSAMGASAEEALCEYLVGQELVALPTQMERPVRRTSGDYTVQYRVFLGQQGFRNGALTMLDYLEQLPPGRELIVVCQGRYEWITGNIPFVLQFIAKLRKTMERGTRLMLVNRRGYSINDTAAFAWPWLLAHLRGYIRSRYYDGELPENVRFLASVPGFWCGYVEEDTHVEDNLYLAMHTHPRDIVQVEALCAEYVALSEPASQYNFLQHPGGDEENTCLWGPGPLPQWKGVHGQEAGAEPALPDGSFCAVCRVPGFGLITRAEFREIAGRDDIPNCPAYLFAESGALAPGPHKIILCREDVRDAFTKNRRAHEALSALMGRRAFVSQYMFKKQMRRLLDAMAREDVEVALVPRMAFQKLQMELVCWRNSVAVGYLQDVSNSVFANDQATSGAFYGAIDVIWDKLLLGWRRKSTVGQQLRGWLAGKELDEKLESSSRVASWDIMPKE